MCHETNLFTISHGSNGMTEQSDNKKPNRRDPRHELEDLLKDGEALGREMAEEGRRQTESGQNLADLSRTARNVLTNIPNDVLLYGVEDAVENWWLHIDSARAERDKQRSFDFAVYNSTSGSATISTIELFDNTIPTLPESIRENVYPSLIGFNQVVTRSADKEKVLKLMRDLGLDRPYHDRRSAAEQFETAYDAMSKPVAGNVDPAGTSLIPMREAIETAIDHLLDKRPARTNLPAVKGQNKDWRKVHAIAEQLKKDSIPDSQVASWAQEWSTLKDRSLSPAKTEPVHRDEWARRINTATIFLNGFLSGIDTTKLRRD